MTPIALSRPRISFGEDLPREIAVCFASPSPPRYIRTIEIATPIALSGLRTTSNFIAFFFLQKFVTPIALSRPRISSGEDLPREIAVFSVAKFLFPSGL